MNQTVTLARRTASRSAASLTPLILPAAFGLIALLGGAGVASEKTARVAIAISGAFVFAVLAARKPKAAIYTLVVWLAALGSIRRLTTGVSGAFSFGDPLLLVGPAVLLVATVTAFQRGAFARRSRLTNAVIALSGVLTLSAVNPRQGTVAIGLAGATLVVVPMLAFFIGRSLVGDRTLRRLLVLLLLMGVPAAMYGLFQVFAHFPTWDQRWIDQQGYNALRIGKAIRPFGSFASGQEFGLYMGICLALLVSFSKRLRSIWLAPGFGLFGAAIWYESGRSIIVSALVAVLLLLTLRAHSSLRQSLVIVAFGVALLPVIVGQFTAPQEKLTAHGDLVAHQVTGLADPLGDNSTLPAHYTMVKAGITAGLSAPLGSGVGAVTVAAGRLGGERSGTEFDVGNAAVGGGVIALVAYLAIVFSGFGGAYRLALIRRDPLSYAAVGILAVTFLQWMNGGLYSVVWLPWLVLGWVDAQRDLLDGITPVVEVATAAEPAR